MTSIKRPANMPIFDALALRDERDGEHAYSMGKSPFESGYLPGSPADRNWRKGWTRKKLASERHAGTEVGR